MRNPFITPKLADTSLTNATTPAENAFAAIEQQVSLKLVPSKASIGMAAARRVQDLKSSIQQCDRDLEALYEELPLKRAQVDAMASEFLNLLEAETPPPKSQN